MIQVQKDDEHDLKHPYWDQRSRGSEMKSWAVCALCGAQPRWRAMISWPRQGNRSSRQIWKPRMFPHVLYQIQRIANIFLDWHSLDRWKKTNNWEPLVLRSNHSYRQVAWGLVSLWSNMLSTDACLKRSVLSALNNLHTKPHTYMSSFSYSLDCQASEVKNGNQDRQEDKPILFESLCSYGTDFLSCEHPSGYMLAGAQQPFDLRSISLQSLKVSAQERVLSLGWHCIKWTHMRLFLKIGTDKNCEHRFVIPGALFSETPYDHVDTALAGRCWPWKLRGPPFTLHITEAPFYLVVAQEEVPSCGLNDCSKGKLCFEQSYIYWWETCK